MRPERDTVCNLRCHDVDACVNPDCVNPSRNVVIGDI